MTRIFFNALTFATTCLYYIAFPTQSFSEPTPLPEATPTSKNPHYELLLLERDMAESSFGLHDTLLNRSNLVTSYEKFVNHHCMSDLFKTLQYAGSPQDLSCLEYIEKLLKLDSENPSAICARDGIDSESCAQAYSKQRFLTYDSKSSQNSSGFGVDVEARLSETSNAEKIRETFENFMNVKKKYEKKMDQSTLEEMESLMTDILTLSCKVIRTRLEGILLPTPTKTPARKDPGEGIFDKNPPQTENKTLDIPYERVRYVSPKCLQFIDKALAMDPPLSLAVCLRDGSYSPTCIRARRQERKILLTRKRKTPTKASSSSAPAFETF